MKKKKLVIEGLIIPVHWDDDGNAIEISIQTMDEKEYVVEASREGLALFSHLQKKVIAKGQTRERIDGKELIRVEEYEIVMEYPTI